MADIKIILTSPSNTLRSIVSPPRRLSIPTALRPAQSYKQQGPAKTVIRRPSTVDQKQNHGILHHLHTLLLFTWSDVKNILVPQTVLGVVTAISCSQATSTGVPSASITVLSRLPLALVWVYTHLLIFTTANQTQPSSQLEDAKNKPWRPLPAKRITHTQARAVFYSASAAAIALSLRVGGLQESLFFMNLVYLYNDVALGDSSVTARYLLNATGYTTFALGAVSVLLHNTDYAMTSKGYLWLAMLLVVILTTGHSQDLEDREGDVATGRKTIPVILGDDAARYSIAGAMLGWTLLIPRFWNASFLGTVMLLAIGFVVMKRYTVGDKASYKQTFRLWNCWVVALYLLPLFAQE